MNHDDELLMVCLERRLVAAHIADELRERGGGVVIALIREVGIPPDVIADILVGFGERFGEIDGWRLLVPLGEGSSATVWLGERNDERAAIKVVRINDAGDAARLAREIDAASRVAHPRVLQMLESGTHDGLPYLVFPYIAGGDVEFRIQQAGRIDEKTALRWMHDAAEGLEAIHAVGLLHRDLKPANLLIDSDGRAQIADLGLARSGDERLTRTGAILGTPGYMAPEQARGLSELTEAIDIYALGACLFACSTGRPPFIGGTPWEIVAKVAKETAPDPREFAPQIGGQARAIIRCCLAKDPAARYHTASELREDLACASAGEALRHAGRYNALSAAERPAVEVPAQVRPPFVQLRMATIVGVALLLGYVVGFILRPTFDSQAGIDSIADLEQRVVTAERQQSAVVTAPEQRSRSLAQIQSDIAHEMHMIRELEKQIHSAKLAGAPSVAVKPVQPTQRVSDVVSTSPVESSSPQPAKSTLPMAAPSRTVTAAPPTVDNGQQNSNVLIAGPIRDEVFFRGAIYASVRDLAHDDLVVLSDEMGVIRQSRRTGVTVTKNPAVPWQVCWPDGDEWVGDLRILDLDRSGEVVFSAYAKRGYLGTLSVDQGVTWQAIAVPEPAINDHWQARLLADGNTLLAWPSSKGSKGIYQSTDRGVTWKKSKLSALNSSVVVGDEVWFAEVVEGGVCVIRDSAKQVTSQLPLANGDRIIAMCGIAPVPGQTDAAVALTEQGRFISITANDVALCGALPRYIIQQRPVALAAQSNLNGPFVVLTQSGLVYLRNSFYSSSLDTQGMLSCPYAIRTNVAPLLSWDADICQVGLEDGLWRHMPPLLRIAQTAGDEALPPWPLRQDLSRESLAEQRTFEGSCFVLASGAHDVRDIIQIDGTTLGILSGAGLFRFALDGKMEPALDSNQVMQGTFGGSFSNIVSQQGSVIIFGCESDAEYIGEWRAKTGSYVWDNIALFAVNGLAVSGQMMEGPAQALPDGRVVCYGMMQQSPGYWLGQINGTWAHVGSDDVAIRCIAATSLWSKFFGWNMGDDYLRVYPRLDANVGVKTMKVDSVSALVGGLILQRTAVEGDVLWIAGHAADRSGRLGQMNSSGQVIWGSASLPPALQSPRLRMVPLGDRKSVFVLADSGALWLTQDGGRTWRSCAVNPSPRPMSPIIRFAGKSDGLIFIDADARLVAVPISDVVASAVAEVP